MANTLPNVVVPARTVVDLYTESGIVVGTKIDTRMIGLGDGRLYSGATLSGRPDNATGYEPIYEKQSKTNDAGDLGAFIWSDQGCTINVRVSS
jgi:hypothetical protein